MINYFDKSNLFCFIHLGRSGSTHVERTLLSSLINPISLGEFNNHKVTFDFLDGLLPKSSLRLSSNLSLFEHSLFRGLEIHQWACRESGIDFSIPKNIFFEFKPTESGVAFSSENSKFISDVYGKYGCRFVILERRSVVRRIISALFAKNTKVFHSDQVANDKSFSENVKFNFDFLNFIDEGMNPGYATNLKEIQYLNDAYFSYLPQLISSVGADYLHLVYEDDVEKDFITGYTKLLDFLHACIDENPYSQSSLIKTTPSDISSFIDNFENLHEYCIENNIRLR